MMYLSEQDKFAQSGRVNVLLNTLLAKLKETNDVTIKFSATGHNDVNNIIVNLSIYGEGSSFCDKFISKLHKLFATNLKPLKISYCLLSHQISGSNNYEVYLCFHQNRALRALLNMIQY